MRSLHAIYERADKVSSWAERFADRAVGVFSEKTRARRAHSRLLGRDEDYGTAYRMVCDQRTRSRNNSHDNTTPWLGLSDRDADGDQIPQLAKRRARSRYIESRDGIGAGIFGSRKRKVIGSGLRLQVRDDDDVVSAAFEAVWNERKDSLYPAEGNLSHVAGQRMIFGRRDVDGDIAICPTVSEPGGPVWFEVIEADRICTPIDVKVAAGHKVVEGVEKDALGRTVAYYVSKRHPGETAFSPWAKGWSPAQAKNVDAFIRIEADRCKLLRSSVARPGQSRGLPLLHSCEQDIHDIDLLVLATLKRAQVAACLTLFITSDAAVEDLFPDTHGETIEESWGYSVGESLKPGEFFRLSPGEKIETTADGPLAPDLDPFVWLYARRIGAAVGRSPQSILGDWSDVNYSGARTIQLEDRIGDDLERKDFSAEFLDWQARLVWRDAILRGDPRLSFATIEDAMRIETEWVGDARHWVDPVKEGEAIKLALSLNLTTLRDEALALGHDWQSVMKQRAKERTFAKELGLPDDTAMLQPQQQAPESDEDDQPAAKKKPKAAVAA